MRKHIPTSLALVLVAALMSFAASDQPSYPTTIAAGGYNTDTQTLAGRNVRATIAVTDILTTTNILSLSAFRVLGRQTLIVHGRFTNASATVGIQIAYIYKNGDPFGSDTTTSGDVVNTIKDWSQTVTLTASAAQKEAAYYESPAYYFDTNGAVTIRMVCTTAPSAGTVTLVCGSE